MIEIMSFRLRPDTDEAQFTTADRRVQTGFAYSRPGLLRRTTARSQAGGWIVISLWRSARDADGSAEVSDHDEATAAFMSLIDAPTVRTDRYDTLD